VKDLESLASLIAADLRVADDDDDAALEARRRIASEYQSLDAEERVRLNLLLGTVVVPPPKLSRESEELMSDLKRHGPSTPSPSRPRPRPTSARPDPLPRLPRRPFKYAEPKYAESVEYISEPVEHPRRVTRLTFRLHPFIRHRWPYSNASWCVVCGEIESRHE
jgi:hypothetical protein